MGRRRCGYKPYKKEYRIMVLGSGGVGKTALTMRFIQGYFLTNYNSTIEDSFEKRCVIDGISEKLDIIDRAGEEQSTKMQDVYIRIGHGFLLVFSLIDRASFLELAEAHRHILRCQERDDVPILLVGNKADLVEERVVTAKEIQDVCNELTIPYLECSAKSPLNVDEAFHKIVRLIRTREKLLKQDSRKCVLM